MQLLAIHKSLHPKADVYKLHVSLKMGGSSLKNIKDVIKGEVMGLMDWNNNKGEPLTEAI